MSLPFSGTTKTTSDSEATAEPSGLIIFKESRRLPGAKGEVGTNTHWPLLLATTSPILFAPSYIATFTPGLARPAITVSPCGVMRTISKLGAVICRVFVFVSILGAGFAGPFFSACVLAVSSRAASSSTLSKTKFNAIAATTTTPPIMAIIADLLTLFYPFINFNNS